MLAPCAVDRSDRWVPAAPCVALIVRLLDHLRSDPDQDRRAAGHPHQVPATAVRCAGVHSGRSAVQPEHHAADGSHQGGDSRAPRHGRSAAHVGLAQHTQDTGSEGSGRVRQGRSASSMHTADSIQANTRARSAHSLSPLRALHVVRSRGHASQRQGVSGWPARMSVATTLTNAASELEWRCACICSDSEMCCLRLCACVLLQL